MKFLINENIGNNPKRHAQALRNDILTLYMEYVGRMWSYVRDRILVTEVSAVQAHLSLIRDHANLRHRTKET